MDEIAALEDPLRYNDNPQPLKPERSLSQVPKSTVHLAAEHASLASHVDYNNEKRQAYRSISKIKRSHTISCCGIDVPSMGQMCSCCPSDRRKGKDLKALHTRQLLHDLIPECLL